MVRQLMLVFVTIILLWNRTNIASRAALVTSPSIPIVLNIWPGIAPGETQIGKGETTVSGGIARVSNVYTPFLTIFRSQVMSANSPAVIIMPGGGYSILAQDLEGTEVAEWLNSLGVTAAVLDYRVPNNRAGAFQDGQRAISLLRSKAQEYGINPNKIGVLGFSAGGDLACRTAVSYGTSTYPAVDASDGASNRPDFAVLIYPAYLLDSQHEVAPEVTPHAGMPPIFIEQTMDDPLLDAPGYAQALADAGDPVKLVVYDTGGHGYGLRPTGKSDAYKWKDEAAAWLKKILE